MSSIIIFSSNKKTKFISQIIQEKIESEMADLRHPIEPISDALLKVQCFGNFDVFTPDGTPVHFERSRSKEVFAYLVHRSGSSCTIKEIAAALFEDEPYDLKQQAYIQKIISAMMKSLRKCNAADVVFKKYNSLSVNTSKLDCDYYRFAELDAGAVNAYANEYMSQYYWADFMYDDYDYDSDPYYPEYFEDIDITEVAIQLTSAELTYEAALMASGKVMKATLLPLISGVMEPAICA